MKYNIACGPLPIHKQHLDYMGDLSDWTLVDLYCKDEGIQNWDATKLDEIEDGTADELYASHFLEHIPHVDAQKVVELWYRKLKEGGKVYINVPDLEWACERLIKYLSGAPMDGYYHQFDGEHGLVSIFYGSQSHDGEFHKSGYTVDSLYLLLERVGFKNIMIYQKEEAHEMGCLIARGYK